VTCGLEPELGLDDFRVRGLRLGNGLGLGLASKGLDYISGVLG